MNHQFNDVGFKNNIFEYPDLTRIIGEPTTAALITLWNEVKANTKAVHTILGGGEHSHLGLVCSPTIYATFVPVNTPYIKPPNPGRLIIEGTETHYQIAAVEPKYLKTLRNLVANKIIQSIPAIFDYLFETYSNVTPTTPNYPSGIHEFSAQ